ncbi:MAG TPA: AAA family ATPase [Candidatus Binataceae bacterium]|nr:AAA family ATPase [Candidatus Binataceae bacterium]
MYFRFEIVQEAIEKLRSLHPFFGISYLVCKKAQLPIGKAIPFSINHEEEAFLDTYYKPNPNSEYFFQPFRTSSREGGWIVHKYPFSGSQSTRTRGRLGGAFVHPRNTNLWGWSTNYIDILKQELDIDKVHAIPALWLAIWIYRNHNWQTAVGTKAIEDRLFSDFYVSREEREKLFLATVYRKQELYTDEAYSDKRLLQVIKPAPDSVPEVGGTLRLLEMKGLGPSAHLSFQPAERLSIITGDNGLGKTFILECAWWALTGHWAGRAAFPNPDQSLPAVSIKFEIAASKSRPESITIRYDWNTQQWPAPKGRPTLPGLVVYARVDGSFAVWDPARHSPIQREQRVAALVVSRDEVLNGLEGQIEGLLRDWVRWQNSSDQREIFETFCAVLEKLSPPDMSPLKPGRSIRIPGEAREIPTLKHPYGDVPFTNESAGVRRIVTLAYLLVWCWNEHKIYSKLSNRPPQRQLVVLIDEVEAHLHPKWQRVALPALLEVATILSNELQYQAIVATHSPLILASIEAEFSDSTDKLFHLRLTGGGLAEFTEIPFIRHGSVDRWLTSEIFELRQARSRESESILEEAKKLMSTVKPDAGVIHRVSGELRKVLPEDDQFWPRWLFFAESKGVKL